MKRIIIIWAGCFAREVSGWVIDCINAGEKWVLGGFLDDRKGLEQKFELNAPILSSCEDYEPKDNDFFLCGIGDPAEKRKYSKIIEQKGGKFVNLIHPTAVVGNHSEMGHGVILGPFSLITSYVKIGNHVVIPTFSAAAHDVEVGDYCQLSSHCALNGNVKVGEGVFFGAHTCVCPGGVIEPWAYVGAGSVVLKRVKAKKKVFGNPARVIGDINEDIESL